MGELGHTSVTPRVAPRVREEDYDGVMLPNPNPNPNPDPNPNPNPNPNQA